MGLQERVRLLWEVVSRSWVFRIGLVVWGLIGAVNLTKSEFFPRDVQEQIPTTYELIITLGGWLSVASWLLVLSVILNVAALEFIVRQNRSNARRGADIAVTGGEAVAYPQWQSLKEIDLATAAAIYSGTRDDNDVNRHLRFRELKQAIRDGKLAIFDMNGAEPNIRTSVTPKELKSYFDQVRNVR